MHTREKAVPDFWPRGQSGRPLLFIGARLIQRRVERRHHGSIRRVQRSTRVMIDVVPGPTVDAAQFLAAMLNASRRFPDWQPQDTFFSRRARLSSGQYSALLEAVVATYVKGVADRGPATVSGLDAKPIPRRGRLRRIRWLQNAFGMLEKCRYRPYWSKTLKHGASYSANFRTTNDRVVERELRRLDRVFSGDLRVLDVPKRGRPKDMGTPRSRLAQVRSVASNFPEWSWSSLSFGREARGRVGSASFEILASVSASSFGGPIHAVSNVQVYPSDENAGARTSTTRKTPEFQRIRASLLRCGFRLRWVQESWALFSLVRKQPRVSEVTRAWTTVAAAVRRFEQ